MLRDSVIQRFEYTYELCWKMLKRIKGDASLFSVLWICIANGSNVLERKMNINVMVGRRENDE